MYQLAVIRHGESEWNQKNLFCGWTDVDLTENGRKEAKQGGKLLLEEHCSFDICYTSVLKRAIHTAYEVLDVMDLAWIPVIKDYRLNERHYGALQGLNKVETSAKYGEEQVRLWRRSYDVRPPALPENDPRNPKFLPPYRHLQEQAALPLTECLKDTVARVAPYFETVIAPQIKSGKKVLIAAHGNSIRALMKYLENISDEEIAGINIPTGVPLLYDLTDSLAVAGRHYLGDPEAVQSKIAAVRDQSRIR